MNLICPHCSKEIEIKVKGVIPKSKVQKEFKIKSMRGLPNRTSLPSPNELWNCHERYFDVGDTISWMPCTGTQRGVIRTDKVGRVKRNMYGRISYYTESNELVLMEEIREALCQKE